MAIAITSTPPLTSKDARKFFKKVNEDLKNLDSLKIPSLRTAEKRVLAHALQKKK